MIELKSTHIRLDYETKALLEKYKRTEETDAQFMKRLAKDLQDKAMDRAEAEGKKRWQIGE